MRHSWRAGELSGLRWGDLDLDRGRLDVLRSYRTLPKSGKPRHVPVHPELAPPLREWRARCPETAERLVFPVRTKSGRWRMGRRDDDNGLPELMRACGCHVPAKPWHSLRHTFAAHSVMSGMPLYTLQKLMGHSTPEMTQIYAHLAPDYMAAEMMRLSFGERHAAPVASLDDERRRRAMLAD